MTKNFLKETELHVHLLQCLYPEDIFNLAKDNYKEINWNRFGFLERYEKIYKKKIDLVKMFEKAIKTGSIEEIKDVMTYKYSERGDFDKFNITSFFPLCVTGFYMDKGDFRSVVKPILDRHKKEGLKHVEYRQGVGYSDEVKEEWKEWHEKFIRILKDSSDEEFQAKYVMRISENSYEAVKEFMEENPELNDTLVGLDFTGREMAPKLHEKFFKKLKKDNEKDPETALDIVVHIGEDFFDKSLESAIRWCHETAELGAKRLGHCIALGLDPEIATGRKENAHEEEKVSERIDQINYDLKYYNELKGYGINLNRNELEKELNELNNKDSDEKLIRKYDNNRFKDIKLRQDFVLEKFKEMGTVIEVCPTSNLRIGGVPEYKYHPFNKFYDSGVNMVICTDDPGIFDITLKSEVDLIAEKFEIEMEDLKERLGNPYKYRMERK